jgi:hypothetical protein
MAGYYFRSNDDLTSDLPARDDRPARGNWDMLFAGSSAVPLARQSKGDYSWLVTVSPTTRDARDGLARNPESFLYDVSVVVFYKRLMPTEIPAVAKDMNPAMATERAISGRIISTGPNGGELLLQSFVNPSGAYVDGIESDPFLNLKTGQWILLCGPHPNSTTNQPRFVAKWYRVMTIDKPDTSVYPTSKPNIQRIVSLRGPEWPWKPVGDPFKPNNELSNDLCVGIFRGAVAVHTKTMPLEKRGSGGGGMALTPTTPGQGQWWQFP